MAEPGVEASVFQIPDLVGAANKQQQQKLLRQQQQDYRTQSFLSDFKEIPEQQYFNVIAM